VALSIPAALPEGAWKVGLRLADKDSSLRRDPRYAVRFANSGVWNADSGINDLKANLVISMNAPGARDTSFRIFRVVEPGLPIRGRSLSGTGEFRLQRRPGGILEIHSVRARGNGFEVFLTTLNGKSVRQARPILSGTSRKR
jgi:hypothetical protein